MNTICKKLNPAAIVSNLTAGYVSNNLFSANEKPGTKNERLRRFKALIRWAYQQDYLADIRWIDKLKPVNDKEAKEKLENKFLEREQLCLLLDTMELQHWKWVAQFMALTGARVGEVLALNITDVDFNAKLIHINKTLDSQIKDDVHSPKTSCSNRDVDMQPELERLCKDIKNQSENQI